MKTKIPLLFIVLAIPVTLWAQGYMKPPKEIMDVLNAPVTPITLVSPAKDRIALLFPVRYPPVADLAEPMLRLAGIRINPKTNSRHRQRYYSRLVLKEIAAGKEQTVKMPRGARIISPAWSADGRYLAVGNITPTGVELWIVETSKGRASRIEGIQLNTVIGGFKWMPDRRSLLVNLVRKARGPAPLIGGMPEGPAIQETKGGKAAAVRTYQDLLASPNDEKLFKYFATSQLAVVKVGGEVRKIGDPAIFAASEVSPDAKFILVSRIKRPYSYLFPYFFFAKEVEVWNLNGGAGYKVASIPLQNNLPVQGVPTGPRSYGWIPTEDATLIWVEALDGGDPRRKITPRDKMMKIAAPFNATPSEVLRIGQRYSGRMFGEKNGRMWFYDYDRNTQHRRLFMANHVKPSAPKLVSDINRRDRYNNIGSPVTKLTRRGKSVVIENGGGIFLAGRGATPEGDRPFLRKMNIDTLKTTEMFRSAGDKYEVFIGFADEAGLNFFTRRESKTVPANLFLNYRCPEMAKCDLPEPRQITDFRDPTPQLRGITKKLVRYKRPDGVDLSFTLYLPPNYKKDERLPTIVWAYPLEYTNAATAGQVSGSPNRFTTIRGYSHLFFLLEGYAVLDNATMPIVGDPLTVNDTFIDQLVASAKAAIDKGVEIGVVDPERVGVGGHSYGAFMTAHLLAQSNLFRAGIARSGAYNRTLTPFGFQSERRSFWEAPQIYFKLSPFMAANKINEPMLMIHGEADNNSGTYPMQSKRMFAAIKGNGGTARVVMLPFESHGYAGRESIEHTLWEMVNWMDRYVKNAKPRKTDLNQQ